jgi:hypothetical protein
MLKKYFFLVVYFTTGFIDRANRKKTGKDEWEVVLAISLNLLEGIEKVNEKLQSALRARIRTSYLPHTSPKLYRYTGLNCVYQ